MDHHTPNEGGPLDAEIRELLRRLHRAVVDLQAELGRTDRDPPRS